MILLGGGTGEEKRKARQKAGCTHLDINPKLEAKYHTKG